MIDDDWGWPWYGHFGVKQNGRLWVAGGADSSRGMWGMILVEEENAWRKYKLDNVYYADALFLSDTEVLACGATLNSEDPKNNDNRRHGIVLYSSDGGRTWSVVYSDTQVTSINDLAVGTNCIWAVGDNGLALRLEFSR